MTEYYVSPRWSNEILDCSMPMTFDTYNKCSYDCLYCVLGKTLIATPGGKKEIKKIGVGDFVYTFNLKTKSLNTNKVLQIMNRMTDEVMVVNIDGKKIPITAEHPFYVKNKGWVLASKLKVGDKILSI